MPRCKVSVADTIGLDTIYCDDCMAGADLPRAPARISGERWEQLSQTTFNPVAVCASCLAGRVAEDVREKERALAAVWQQICARKRDSFLDGLEHSERVFAAIWMLEAEINNGGLSQWMFNSYSDHADLAVAGLREVGANAAADVCERFFTLLPGGRPAADQDSRQAQLDAASLAMGEARFGKVCAALEKEFYALEDDLRDRLWAFWRRVTKQ